MSAIIEWTEEQTAISAQAETWPERARSIRITTDLDYAEAGAMLQGVKGLMKEADSVFDAAVKKAHEAHKAIVAAKNGVVAPLKEAEKILKAGMADYHDERERRRLEDQRRLQAEADRLAAEERKRLEAERAREISEAAERGVVDFIEVLAKPEPVPVVAPVVEIRPGTVKLAGVSTRTIWRAEVVDFAALVRYVADRSAESPSVLSLLSADMTRLSEMARALKGTATLPGVTFKSETVVASR